MSMFDVSEAVAKAALQVSNAHMLWLVASHLYVCRKHAAIIVTAQIC
mgnify:CR=1 FL=1